MTGLDCCSDVRGSECHCGRCHRTFTGLTLFDDHQDVDYRRPHADVVQCRDPASRGLAQSARGTWGTPEGLRSRERSALLLATARSRRAQEVRQP
jgi:hypothetical protein